MTKFNFVINIEVADDKGEDANLSSTEKDFEQYKTFLMGVFDGLGGRSAGYDGKTGGRIASEEASQITKRFLKQWYDKITPENIFQLQQEICRSLKHKADTYIPKTSSRLKGSLLQHRLCTTVALASIPNQQGQEKFFEADLAWMGDSRIYFLSSTKGLQQLTKDDLVTPKDALEMLRQDPPMSQFLSADINPAWQIHYQHHTIEEQGCFLACTDGCFQYFSAPWQFENLLLDTLLQSTGDTKNDNNWQHLINEKYTEIKQDDVSLILYPVGFGGIKNLRNSYQERWQYLQDNFILPMANASYEDVQTLWAKYRIDYEYYLQFIPENPQVAKPQLPESSSSLVTSATSTSSSNNIFQEITQSSKDKAAAKAEKIKEILDQAYSFYQNNQLEEAKSFCHQVLDIDSEECESNYLLGLIYTQVAGQSTYYQKPKLFQDAASYFKRIVDNFTAKKLLSNEKVINSYQHLGYIYCQLKFWEKAIEAYQFFFISEGIEKLENWPEALSLFVFSLQSTSVHNKREMATAAILFCHRLIDKNSILPYGKIPLIHFFLAELYEIQGEFNTTIHHLQIVLDHLSELDYAIRKKAEQKYQLITYNLNNRGYH